MRSESGVQCFLRGSLALTGFAFGFAAGSWAGLQLNDPKRRYGIYGCCIMIWAALISLSRVMLAAHYLGDILVGSLFGLALGYALARLAHWAMVKARL